MAYTTSRVQPLLAGMRLLSRWGCCLIHKVGLEPASPWFPAIHPFWFIAAASAPSEPSFASSRTAFDTLALEPEMVTCQMLGAKPS